MSTVSYDWCSFQSMFYPRRRSAVAQQSPEASTPVYLVVEDDKIISAFAECEDLALWIGSTYQEMAAELPHRELVLFERGKVEEFITHSLTLPHFFDQVEYLRKEATGQLVARKVAKNANKAGTRAVPLKSKSLLGRQHFMLEAIQGWWAKVLPSAYGVFIRLEGQPSRDLLLLVRRGRIESFLEPDLASMGPERKRQPDQVVKYLSEKYLVPIQGVFVVGREWADWSESPDPWRQVAFSIQANRTKLVPFRWTLASLVTARAFLHT